MPLELCPNSRLTPIYIFSPLNLSNSRLLAIPNRRWLDASCTRGNKPNCLPINKREFEGFNGEKKKYRGNV